MSQCIVKKKDGTLCKGQAGDGKYCPIHRRRFEKRIVHGKYAQKEVLGVPLQYAGMYQDFLDDEKPFDLRREMALLRTLFVEARNNLDASRYDKADRIEEEVVERLSGLLKGSPEKMKPLLTVVGQVCREVLKEELDLSWLSMKEAISLSELLEAISRVAERMKKIQEGVKLQVSIDTNILVRFLQQVVFPEIPEPARRERMIMRASRLGISRVEKLPSGGDEEVLCVATTTQDCEASDTVPVSVAGHRPRSRPLDALDVDAEGDLLPLDVSSWD